MATAKKLAATTDPAAGLRVLRGMRAQSLWGALASMRAAGEHQLWIPDVSEIDRSAPALERAAHMGWDIHISPLRQGQTISDPNQPAAHDDWMLAYRSGEYDRTKRGYSLVFPSLDPRHIWWEQDAKGKPTQVLGDPLLGDALATYARALGLPFYRSPNATASRLMRALHRGEHATAFETTNKQLPPMAAKEGAWVLQDAPIMWRRAVTPDVLEATPYLLTFDVNAQFLRAANGLQLGFGEVNHLEGEMARGYTDTALMRGPGGQRLIAPGYYRVAMNGQSALTRLPMPHPLYRAGRADEPFGLDGCWVCAPTVRLLVEQRMPFTTTEAYIWRESHRFFDPWYKQVNAARMSLIGDATPAGKVALRVLKATYTQFFGSLADSRPGEASALYRPDWRHADTTEARALLYRNMLAAADNGYWPVLVTEDTLGYLVETSDPTEAAAALGLRLSDTAGQYKLKDCVDTRTRGDVQDALLDGAMDARAMQSLLASVRREMGRDA